jgi:hypothetical protein
VKRSAHVRAAVAKSREARLRGVERRLTAHLRFLKRRDREGYESLVGVLRRVVAKS